MTRFFFFVLVWFFMCAACVPLARSAHKRCVFVLFLSHMFCMTCAIGVLVANRLYISLDELSSVSGMALREAMESETIYDNPTRAAKLRMGLSVYGEPLYYKTHLAEDGYFSLPLGAMSRLRARAAALGIRLSVSDARMLKPVCAPAIPDTLVSLHDYQLDVIESVCKKQVCIVRAPTGSGKTTASIGLIAKLKLKTLVIVWSSNLMQQWIVRISKELGIPKSKIGVIKGRKKTIGDITVAMQQTMAKSASRYANEFGLVICDEVQRFAAKTFVAAVEPLCSKYRVGISADETRKDKKEFLIYDTFGSVAAEISQDVLISQGHVMDVSIKVVPTSFVFDGYRPGDMRPVLDKMSRDERRNKLILDLVSGLVSNGRQVLVMSTRRDHCLVLDGMLADSGIKTGTLIGGDDYKVAFEDTRRGILSGAISVGVGTIQAVGQGLDIPSLSAVVVASPLASNKQLFGQARGRACRVSEGKSEAFLFYIWDRLLFGTRPVENIIRWYPSASVLMDDGDDPIRGSHMPAKGWLAMDKINREDGRASLF